VFYIIPKKWNNQLISSRLLRLPVLPEIHEGSADTVGLGFLAQKDLNGALGKRIAEDMKLPRNSDAVIPEKKITHYLPSEAHPVEGPKPNTSGHWATTRRTLFNSRMVCSQ
jgi:hypothetical protein